MVRLADRRMLAVVFLSLALLTPWSAEALPLESPSPNGVVDRLTEWLTALLGNIGCSADPSGCTSLNQPAPPADNVDVGCSADPGGCRSVSQPAPLADNLNVGCSADPNGACRSNG